MITANNAYIELLTEDKEITAAAEGLEEYTIKTRNTQAAIAAYLDKQKEAEKPLDEKSLFSFGTRKLRKFDGSKPEDWYAWWAEYRIAIEPYDTSKYVTDAQRLGLLKDYVVGVAGDRIKDLPMDNIGYQAALDLLEGSYGSKSQQVIRTHRKILDCPKAGGYQNGYNFKEIDRVRGVFYNACMMMQRLGFDVEANAGFIFVCARATFPQRIIELWDVEMEQKKDPADKMGRTEKVYDFLTFVKTRGDTLYDPSLEGKKDKASPAVSSGSKSSKPSGQVLHTTGKMTTCAMCNGPHVTDKCNMWRSTPAQELKKLLWNKRLCFTCGEPVHGSGERCSSSPCGSQGCSGKIPHRSVLCSAFKTQKGKNQGKSKNKGTKPKKNTAMVVQEASESGTKHTVEDLAEELRRLRLEAAGVNSRPAWLGNPGKVLAVSSSNTHDVILETLMCVILIKSGMDENGPTWVRRRVRVLLDTGATVNLIRREFVQGIKAEEVPFHITVAGESTSVSAEKRIEFKLKSLDGSYESPEFEAKSYNRITTVEEVDFDHKKFPHLREIPFTEKHPASGGEIDVLLGLEVVNELDLLERISGGHREPVAKKTRLGWVLSGALVSPRTERKMIDYCFMTKSGSVSKVTDSTTGARPKAIARPIQESQCEEVEPKVEKKKEKTSNIALDRSLNRLWTLESLGINDPTDSTLTIDQERAVEMFREGLEYRDQKYYVPILWKDSTPELENNYDRALKRDEGLCKRFGKPGMEQKKEAFIKAVHEFFEKGHAVEISREELESGKTDGPTRYLSMQVVFREDKPKPRPVFDASETTRDGKSLNNQVLQGPNNVNNLVEVMLKFRANTIALVGDIKGMFLAIGLKDSTDSHRFLWRDLDIKAEPKHCKLVTVTFGVTDSPFKSIEVTHEHARRHEVEYPLAAIVVLEEGYVDDMMGGAKDSEGATEVFRQLDKLLKIGGFELAKVVSNSESVMNAVPEHQRAPMTTRVIDDQGEASEIDKSHSALGTTWDPKSDCLLFRFSEKFEDLKKQTKRTLVSQAAMVYDPTGLIAPVTLQARIMARECCTLDLGWDEELPDDLRMRFNKWKREIVRLNEVKIPRCFVPVGTYSVQFHIFTDASAYAYGAVVYVRSRAYKEEYETRILMAKNRLSPKDILDKKIPRLELLGCLVGVRLYKYVRGALEKKLERMEVIIEPTIFWSDSQIALYWIRKQPGQLKQFVGNRVKEIQSHTSPEQWRHIPGEMNWSADTVSRGCDASTLVESDIWFGGPEFLRYTESEWNIPPLPQFSKEQIDLLRAEEKLNTDVVLNVQEKPANSFVGELLGRWESFEKCKRVMAMVLRARDRFLWRRTATKDAKKMENIDVTSTELEEAMAIFVIYAQRTHEDTRQAYNCCVSGEQVKSPKLTGLHPMIDGRGVMIARGRFPETAEKIDLAIHPIILPNHKSELTRKLVGHVHQRMGHVGAEQTLYVLRQKYWIMGGRRTVKSVLNSCLPCRIFKAKPMSQTMAELPVERLSLADPFTFIACDYLGPLYYTDRDKGGRHKAYICLFSCLSTRAVHLELTKTLTTEGFLVAFNRMVARRGWPQKVYSDNARTFTRADKAICNALADMDWGKVTGQQPSSGVNTVEWTFTAPRAAWWGGVYERMVGLVKERLKRSLGKAHLDYAGLDNVMVNAEAIVNSRPLGVLKDEFDEPTPICPGHFLMGRPPAMAPERAYQEEAMKQEDVLYMAKRKRSQTKRFWIDFQRDYLAELQIRQKWKEVVDLDALKGAVVIVRNDQAPKLEWSKAIVTEVTPGRDGHVRSCEVRLPNKKLIRRAVQSLALIQQGPGHLQN